MGERKVLNKYYPPDFDPALIPRRKQPKNQQITVRMMLPMSIRCATCGEYTYKGTKFNSRKEDVVGEKYLGIQVFRFYFRCPRCSSEMTMKTDPKNSDYVVEGGAMRLNEPWRDIDKARDEFTAKREAEEMGDAMKALENRTLDSKREMDIIAALDEMKSMKARQAQVNPDQILEALKRTAEEQAVELDAADEAAIQQFVLNKSKPLVKRLEDAAQEEAPTTSKKRAGGDAVDDDPLVSDTQPKKSKKEEVSFAVRPKAIAVTVKAKVKPPDPPKAPIATAPVAKPAALGSLLAAYDSDADSQSQ
eukprot:jgi/Chlat1/1333/Chrsp118S01753